MSEIIEICVKVRVEVRDQTNHLYSDFLIEHNAGTSLVVQWLILHAPSAGGPGLIPGQGTRSHMPQLRVRMPQLKVPHATDKTQRSQIKYKHINKYFKKIEHNAPGNKLYG